VSIYATHTAKAYRVKVPLSNGSDVVVEYQIYIHNPIGSGDDVVEIDGIDRDGRRASVIVPLKVLAHLFDAIGENYDLAVELFGEEHARELLKKEIRERREREGEGGE
jgi:hypothetical protein